MTPLAAYAGLFAASFLAATIFPFQSELVLLGLLLSGDYPWPVLLAVATMGNVLGAVVNWGIGRFFVHFRDRRWFPVKPADLRQGRALVPALWRVVSVVGLATHRRRSAHRGGGRTARKPRAVRRAGDGGQARPLRGAGGGDAVMR